MSYRAWDSRLDRHVALKLIADPGRDGESGSSIIAEGRLLARVRHPNVVTIYGADRIDGSVGLWMEFVHGQTLERLLTERGAFGWQEALLVGIDLCRRTLRGSSGRRRAPRHQDAKRRA